MLRQARRTAFSAGAHAGIGQLMAKHLIPIHFFLAAFT